MIQSVAFSSTPVSFGFETRARFAAPSSTIADASGHSNAAENSASGAAVADAASTSTRQVNALTPQELRQVRQLEQIDREVRAHEQAHLAVGGDLVRGGATFTYQTGPDQKRYAVGGEVSIDASPARTAQETIPKAQHIRAAALAPADPSAQDNSVAARADRLESEARQAIAAQQAESSGGLAGAYQASERSQASDLGRRLDAFA